MLKTIIFISLLFCAALAYAADTSEPQQEHHNNKNKHHLQHTKQLEEHQLGSLEHHEAADKQHSRHKDQAKNALSKSEHGAKHHMQHGKVKTNVQAPRRVRKPQREERKKNSEVKVKHAGAVEARKSTHKRKHAKRGHEGQGRAARGHKLQH